MGVFGRIRESLSRTKQQIVDRFDEIVRRADAPERRSRPVDVETIEALEELLISADIGVAATDRIISAVKARSRERREPARPGQAGDPRGIFDAVDQPMPVAVSSAGHADRRRQRHRQDDDGREAGESAEDDQGQQPLICAADTFRAAAVEQLEIWAGRAGVDMVRAREGADPAAVVFDAISLGEGAADAIRCSSTPPAGCTRA